jgi:hypothetical protein
MRFAELPRPEDGFVVAEGASEMELQGSLIDNVQAALVSAKRHRGKLVYAETLQFWREVLAIAQGQVGTFVDGDTNALTQLASELESEINARR